MKKLALVLIISFVFIGCNSDKENVKYNKGLNFEEINKKKGFNFEKNNYNFKKSTKDLDSNKSQLHQGCTAPCCSE